MKGNKSVVTTVVIIVLLLIVVGAVFALAGNKKNDSKPPMDMSNSQTDKSSQSDTKATATNSVTINNFSFSPNNITVKVGTTVTWTNQDSVEHDIVADDGISDGPKSELLAKGKSYSFTFSKAGTYTYHCSVHPDMTGTVTVTE